MTEDRKKEQELRKQIDLAYLVINFCNGRKGTDGAWLIANKKFMQASEGLYKLRRKNK